MAAAGQSENRILKQVIINVLIFVGIIGIVATQYRTLPDTFASLAGANLMVLPLIFIALCITYLFAAYSYYSLADNPEKVSYTDALTVQVASGFANRLLPAGIGGMGLFAAFLHKHGIGTAKAAAIVMTNNILGLAGNVILLAIIFVITPAYFSALRAPEQIPKLLPWIALSALLVLGILSWYNAKHKGRVVEAVRSLLGALATSLKPNSRMLKAFMSNVLLTCTYTVILALSVLTVHDNLDLPIALIALSLGAFVGAAVPTPGGVGGVEAGMIAGLVAFGIPLPHAISAVFICRLFTYWLPIIPGFVLFESNRNKLL
jgi:undecaprenyl-diphosphatase